MSRTCCCSTEPFGRSNSFTREEASGRRPSDLWNQKRRRLVILVTHDLREAAYLASRICVMRPPNPQRARSWNDKRPVRIFARSAPNTTSCSKHGTFVIAGAPLRAARSPHPQHPKSWTPACKSPSAKKKDRAGPDESSAFFGAVRELVLPCPSASRIWLLPRPTTDSSTHLLRIRAPPSGPTIAQQTLYTTDGLASPPEWCQSSLTLGCARSATSKLAYENRLSLLVGISLDPQSGGRFRSSILWVGTRHGARI